MFLYINFPSWIHPQIFPGVKILGLLRWYGLMYVFAFGTAYLLLKRIAREGLLDGIKTDGKSYKITEDDLFSFLGTGILFLLIGARLGSTLIYDRTGIYLHKPWLIFWPFDGNGNYTGFAGMSYHGGFIGGLLGMIVWCKRHKQPVMRWIDAMVCCIPLGYTFGRLGNFLNGELYGRVTTAPWGMVFPAAETFSSSLQWVQDMAAKIGMDISSIRLVNLPRHPSQLYEAFFEGIVLWTIIWLIRKHKKFDGLLAGVYTSGYGIFRFFIEYFREPDEEIGFIFGDKTANIYENVSLTNFSTGQLLCFIMILGGILLALIGYFLEKKNQKSADNKKR
ncbi:MAG: prolipoprotein diacylglyceryl transferase [Treponema sp.]|nr:prolipoprotein diacylglyceryl transferase [Treponema sp.]